VVEWTGLGHSRWEAVAIGDVTTSEAAELAKLIDTYVRAVEATDLDKRLRAIEQAMTK
jgi:hypothetical protein